MGSRCRAPAVFRIFGCQRCQPSPLQAAMWRVEAAFRASLSDSNIHRHRSKGSPRLDVRLHVYQCVLWEFETTPLTGSNGCWPWVGLRRDHRGTAVAGSPPRRLFPRFLTAAFWSKMSDQLYSCGAQEEDHPTQSVDQSPTLQVLRLSVPAR